MHNWKYHSKSIVQLPFCVNTFALIDTKKHISKDKKLNDQYITVNRAGDDNSHPNKVKITNNQYDDCKTQ